MYIGTSGMLRCPSFRDRSGSVQAVEENGFELGHLMRPGISLFDQGSGCGAEVCGALAILKVLSDGFGDGGCAVGQNAALGWERRGIAFTLGGECATTRSYYSCTAQCCS